MHEKDEHLLGLLYLLDHRRILGASEDGEWPDLDEELEDKARSSPWVAKSTAVMAEYEMRGEIRGSQPFWPKTAFHKDFATMEPRAYWRYVRDKLAVKKDEARSFADMMLRFCSCPTSNAAVERKFSSAALDQTALRNRLEPSTMEKLLRVSTIRTKKEDI